jgi:zinc transport system ATP-binding protein
VQEHTNLVRLTNISMVCQNKKILDCINFDIVSNRILTLIGPNGAGKSTVARIILGLLAPTSGEVYKKPGIKLGYVPQNFHVDKLIPITVARFLQLYGKFNEKIYVETTELLKLNRLLGLSLYNLSGGEMQRVLIAQALMNQPDLLVLDEPAQGMDISAQAELYELMKLVKAKYKLGIFMISHDLHLVMQGTDEVICLNKHICCHGAPEEIQKQPEYLRTFGIDSASISMYVHNHDHVHHFNGEVTGDD